MKRPACPRCAGGLIAAEGVGPGVGRCEGCGCFVCTGDARRALTRWLRVDEDVWATLVARGERGPACALCEGALRTFALKAVVVDGCGSCGALLLDPGELQAGPAEPPAPPPAPRAPPSPDPATADDIAPGAVGRIYADAGVALESFLGDAQWVQLVQERQLGEVVLAIERANTYTVRTATGAGRIALSEGLGARLLLAFAGGLLRSRYVLTDARGTPTLTLVRSFERLVLSRLDVRLWTPDAEDGELQGSVERSFRIAAAAYELKDARGRVFARLERPWSSLWQFLPLLDARGERTGAIAKQWSGFATEWLTDADDFGIDFGATAWTLAERATILAAALAIDLDHFERRARDGVLTDLLTS